MLCQVLLTVHNGHPFGIAVDRKCVYWTDWLTHNIESVDKHACMESLDKHSNASSVERTVLRRGLRDLMEIHVFHSDTTRPSGHTSHTHYQTIRSQLTRSHSFYLSILFDWCVVVSITTTTLCVVVSPCNNNNNNNNNNTAWCSHLCLLSPSSHTQFSCACPAGVLLNSDNRTCNNGRPKYYFLC